MRPNSILVTSALLCAVAQVFGQQGGQHIDMEPEVVADRAPDVHPSVQAIVDHGSGRSVGGGNSANRVVDLYPALTAANNAYDQAVAAWQRAFNSYQQALNEQKAIRDKYVDAATNTVRPGFDYYAALTVVRSADDKVQDAWLELDQREKARNEAYSRASEEFTRAMKGYYGGGGAAGGQGGSPNSSSPSPGPSNPSNTKVDRACGHC